GDSMIPTLLPGDKVICSRLDDLLSVSEGTLLVIVTKSDVVSKRIYFDDLVENTIICRSDNENYKNYTVPLSDVQEAWLIKAKITSSFVDITINNTSRMDSLEMEIKDIKKKFGDLLEQFSRLTH